MALGPKELELRRQREARASGVEKRRTAAPSAKAARDIPRKGGDSRIGQEKAPVPPPAGASATRVKSGERPSAVGKRAIGRPRGPERRPVLLEIEPELLARVDEFQVKCNLASRMAALRMLLERGLK